MCTYVRNYFCRVEAILKLDDSMKYLDISIALQLRSRIVFKSMAPKYKSIINKRKKLKFLLPFLLIVLTLSIKTSSAESAEILLEGSQVGYHKKAKNYIIITLKINIDCITSDKLIQYLFYFSIILDFYFTHDFI